MDTLSGWKVVDFKLPGYGVPCSGKSTEIFRLPPQAPTTHRRSRIPMGLKEWRIYVDYVNVAHLSRVRAHSVG